MISSTNINKKSSKYLYSVCTLVTKYDEYQHMLDSFREKGFNKSNTEFLYIDNTNGNYFDAYSGLNHLLNISTGRYIILCHQDIIIKYDNESTLSKRLLQLDNKDKNWALAGNAGGIDLRHTAIRITDLHGTFNKGDFPQRVNSLDENFIIANSYNRIALSNDLDGFHLYGTDICLIADILGYSSYVIDFHVVHTGKGIVDQNFFNCKDKLIKKYNKALKSRYIKTTCTKVFLSHSKIFSLFFNNKQILKIISLLRLDKLISKN
jgi:hypothetical protein